MLLLLLTYRPMLRCHPQAGDTVHSLLDTSVLDSTTVNSTVVAAAGGRCDRCSATDWVPVHHMKTMELAMQVSAGFPCRPVLVAVQVSAGGRAGQCWWSCRSVLVAVQVSAGGRAGQCWWPCSSVLVAVQVTN